MVVYETSNEEVPVAVRERIKQSQVIKGFSSLDIDDQMEAYFEAREEMLKRDAATRKRLIRSMTKGKTYIMYKDTAELKATRRLALFALLLTALALILSAFWAVITWPQLGF